MVDPSSRELIFKFILIGDAGVGKTSILQRYTANRFDKDYHVTVGAEFGSKFINIDDSTRVKLQIWDTAGQESFVNIVRSFYNGSHGVFLVYDVNRRETFENLKKWKDDVCENVDPNAIFVLVGNQVDIGGRQVEYDEGVSFMQDNGIHFFFETSALKSIGIDMAFEEAAKLAFVSYIKDAMARNESIYGSPKKTVVLEASPSKRKQENGQCAC
jgi:Ras-related protein Rab-2A